LIATIRDNAWQSQRTRDLVEPVFEESEEADRINKAIMQRLRFPEMKDREGRIANAHKKTFEWMYQSSGQQHTSKTRFKDWLTTKGDGIYWITGKAGSGKSTLMKFLHQDSRNMHFLERWSSGKKLITAAFFFWNSGSNIQMSMSGLLRSLLYQTLRKLPQSIQKVFPERWEVLSLFGQDDYPWRWQELAEALKALILQTNSNERFFFLIDGLDEFDGNLTDLIDLILDLVASAPNLKICAASRPWASFEDAFNGKPSLTMQELTSSDIQLYVCNKFRANIGFTELEGREPKYAKSLLDEIAKKADGVFLWVCLVVQSLLDGFTNGDRISDLQRRLDRLPTDLESLFRKMLDSLEPGYLEHASQLFQLFRASLVPPTLLCLSLADEDDPEFAFRTKVTAFTDSELLSRCNNMKRRLNSRCRGFIEIRPIQNRPKYVPKFGSAGSYDWSENDSIEENNNEETSNAEDSDEDHVETGCQTHILGRDLANQKLQYLHRTVKDFLETPAVWNWIVTSGKSTFYPDLFLCRSYLLQLKGFCFTGSSTVDIERVWDIVTWCVEHAARAEQTSGDAQIRILDELDRSGTILTAQPNLNGNTYLEAVGGSVGPDWHWTETMLTWTSGSSFLYLAAMCNLQSYLRAKLRPSFFDLQDDNSTPILLAALEDYVFLDRYTDKPFCSNSEPRTEVVRILLRMGADPNQRYRGRTPWEIALRRVPRHSSSKQWDEIISLLREHGADNSPLLPEMKAHSKSTGYAHKRRSTKNSDAFSRRHLSLSTKRKGKQRQGEILTSFFGLRVNLKSLFNILPNKSKHKTNARKRHELRHLDRTKSVTSDGRHNRPDDWTAQLAARDSEFQRLYGVQNRPDDLRAIYASSISDSQGSRGRRNPYDDVTTPNDSEFQKLRMTYRSKRRLKRRSS
jgi:NACHT domain